MKYYRLPLFTADSRIDFNDILDRINDVMQLYRNQIFIIPQGDDGFVNSLRHHFRLMKSVLQQKRWTIAIMKSVNGRFEIVLRTMGDIGFRPLWKMGNIGLIVQLLAQIALV